MNRELFRKNKAHYLEEYEKEALRAKNPILTSTISLVRNSKHMSINFSRLEEYAQEISSMKISLPQWKQSVFIETCDLFDKAAFFYIGNAINFQFNGKNNQKYTVGYRGKEYVGAFALWTALKRACSEGIPILYSLYLKHMPLDAAKYIFRGENMEIPMLEERVKILNEIGRVLTAKYNGQFLKLIQQSNYRLFNQGNGIVERLVRDFPSFDDSHLYRNQKIKFYKRAQLTSAMLMESEDNKGACRIDDTDEFTVFADYSLPNALRDLEIFIYKKPLQEKIDKRAPIHRGSREELEIRANTIFVGRMLRCIANKYLPKDQKINDLHIDAILWPYGRKVKTPYHNTVTMDY